MRILGIDPGINVAGYGCVSFQNGKFKIHEAGVVKPKKSDDMSLRLKDLYENFTEILNDLTPDVVVVEEVFSHVRFPKTSIIMGHARGVLLLCAGLKNIEVISYSANKVKKSVTGNGHATKEQMQRMIMTLLNLKEVPKPHDVADALGVALCHARSINLI